jgi:hypothetical protein
MSADFQAKCTVPACGIKEDNQKIKKTLLGHSDSKVYELLKRDGLKGYLYVEGWRFPVWCTFEHIEEIDN